MPIDFGEWLCRNSGTVEDDSWTGQQLDKSKPLTPLQIRMNFADLLVPKADNEMLIANWLQVFCTVTHADPYSSDIYVVSTDLRYLINEEFARDYYRTEGDIESLVWFASLRSRIKDGWDGS